MLSTNELERYDRQIMIKGFGEEGQSLNGQRLSLLAVGVSALPHLSTWQQPGLE